MITPQDAMTIEHGTPKKVELSQIEAELEVLLSESDEVEGARRTFARALTLAIFCESADLPEVMDELVGHIITRYSARAIVIRAEPGAERAGTEAWIRTHCLTRGERETQLCAEQITLHAHGDSIRQVHNSVLELRLGNLPLVVWWRGQPDIENPLFLELLKAGDQLIFDSARFTSPTAQLGDLVGRLTEESERAPFGDINWARLMPWRELIAQFFDNPEHHTYLRQLSEIALEYSASDGGNPAQAILLTMWLATMLNWEVAGGSWRRNGRDRSLRLRDDNREIRVEVIASEDPRTRPGWLDSVTLRAPTNPAATFQIISCGEGCAKTRVAIGENIVERMVSLAIPDEVELVCSEFDASQRDRVYHHALQVLEQLLA
jgi:glucose-6-phosphate dehydrogenase assembly protein OpcA